jgi:hypothetical protein
MPWFKGNIHCHSCLSDGCATPEHVAKYYQFYDYDFISITDHNMFTPVDSHKTNNSFLGIPGCEYTAANYCHVLGLNLKNAVKPPVQFGKIDKIDSFSIEDSEKIYTLQDGVDQINAAGGIPVLCHPFWNWTYNWEVAEAVKNWKHFEVCNASPNCNSYPTPGGSHGDEMWDKLLSSGHRVFGVATDDAHEYYSPCDSHSPSAGRGYIVINAEKLDIDLIIKAFIAGDFYSSTGIDLDYYEFDRKKINIGIKRFETEKVWFQFFGEKGRELARNYGTESDYSIKGDEIYIRCRMSSCTGAFAWTQPVFIDN